MILGYGDGWCRGDSTKPYMTSEGLPVLGRVSMDFISLESDKEEVCVMNDAQSCCKTVWHHFLRSTTALASDIIKRVI